MGFHTYPLERADALDDPERYRYCSAEELVGAVIDGPTGTVIDLGCGTGFYTLDVAPHAGHTLAVDLQPAMLRRVRAKDPPASVHPVAAGATALPFADDAVSVAFSTMTFHEYAEAAAHDEVRRVLDPDGRLVAIDWRRDGAGATGPPLEERFDLAMATEQLQSAGFRDVTTSSRPETFVLIARPA